MNTKTSTTITPTTPSTIVDAQPCAAPEANEDTLQERQRAWELTRAERSAIALTQLVPTTFELRSALTTMTSAYERIVPYRERLLSELPTLDPRCIDLLPTYCAAIEYGVLRVRWQRESAVEANALADKHLAKCLRAMAPLEDEGLLPAGTVDEIRQGAGWHDRVDDLTRVVVTLTELWPSLVGQTTLKREDIALADSLAKRISAHLGAKGQPTESEDVRLERRQALTLAVTAYDEIRAGMAWLRRKEKDANKLAPSVFTNPYNPRGKSSSRDESDEEGEGEGERDDTGQGEGAPVVTKPADPNAPKPIEAKPAETKAPTKPGKPAIDTKKPAPADEDDDGPIELGPNGLPLVPQDDPFAKD